MTTERMYMLFNFSRIEIATGRMSFIILGTALILPLGLCDETATGRSMYLDYNHIQIATVRINLF